MSAFKPFENYLIDLKKIEEFDEKWSKNRPLLALSIGLNNFSKLCSRPNGSESVPFRYSVKSQIGEGRFSACYHAVDTFNNTPVAIKTFHQQFKSIGIQVK